MKRILITMVIMCLSFMEINGVSAEQRCQYLDGSGNVVVTVIIGRPGDSHAFVDYGPGSGNIRGTNSPSGTMRGGTIEIATYRLRHQEAIGRLPMQNPNISEYRTPHFWANQGFDIYFVDESAVDSRGGHHLFARSTFESRITQCPDLVALNQCTGGVLYDPRFSVDLDLMGSGFECRDGWNTFQRSRCTPLRLSTYEGDLPRTCDELDCETYDDYMAMLIDAAANELGCNHPEFRKILDDINSRCDAIRRTRLYATDDSTSAACQTSCSGLRDNVLSICAQYGDIPVDFECGMSSNLRDWIFRILTIFRYLVPILVILLGVIDFMKAIASNSDDEFKKAGTRFAKRLIAAALVFIVPLLIQFVLDMFVLPGVNPDNPYCL